MIRFFCLMLISAQAFGAASAAVDIDAAAQIYQAAAVRAQVRASLRSMPAKMRQMFASDQAAELTEEQLAAVEAAAKRGFRIDVFEPPALAALAANLDARTVKQSLAFLGSDLGRRMVEADVALAEMDEAAVDKIMSGDSPAPSSPERDALFARLADAARSTESAVQIYLAIGRALAIGTAVGGGMDTAGAEARARDAADAAAQQNLAGELQAPLRRYLAYGYRDLGDTDVKGLLAFLQSPAGRRYVQAYIAAMNAGFDAMARRCGEQIGESWRELSLAKRAVTTRDGAPEKPAK